MVKAVLWDNDGILVNSESVFYEMSRSAFARLGLELTKEIWGLRFLGAGESSREIAVSMGADLFAYRPVLEDRNARYLDILRKNPPEVRSQVRDTLAQLFGRVQLGIVTGCYRDQFDLIHKSSGLLDFFDVIITGDANTKPKPEPDLYLAALDTMNLRAGDCIAVEDSRRGLLAANAAGVECIVVPTELTRMQDLSGALGVEDEISAVLKYI